MRILTRRQRVTAAVSAGTLGLLGLVVPILTAHADTVPDLPQRVAVPAYIPPSDTAAWGRLAGSGSQLGFVVANVASGPGTTLDTGWQSVINTTHGNGVKVLGYVDTGYFGTTTPPRQTAGGATDASAWLTQTEQDVDRWYRLYGASIDGIFFDDAQNVCGPTTGSTGYVALYRQVNAYVHAAHPAGLTVANPGSAVPECYSDAADILVTFEGTSESYLNPGAGMAAAPWQLTADPNKFWNLVYDTPDQSTLATVLARSKQNNAGYVYATPDSLPNPWDTAPESAYWSAELSGTRGAASTGPTASASGGVTSPVVTLDTTTAAFQSQYNQPFTFHNVLIDADCDASTGYQIAGIGADYLIEDGTFYQHSGAGFTWSAIGGIAPLVSTTGGLYRWRIPTSALGTGVHTVQVVFNGSGGSPEAFTAAVTATVS